MDGKTDIGPRSDEELFEEFAKGDDSAFEILVERYYSPLFGYLVRYTRSYHLAEEVLQDCFIKVYEKKHLFQQGRNFRPWLYQIAVNTAKDRFREKKMVNLDPEGVELSSTGLAGHDPSFSAECKEVGNMIEAAVHELPEMQKQVFVMREYDKMSYVDIAETLKRPLNTVKSDMRRAVQRLQKALDSLSGLFFGATSS